MAVARKAARGEAIDCAIGIGVRNFDYRFVEEGGGNFRESLLSVTRQTSYGEIVGRRPEDWSECKIPGEPLPITVLRVRIRVKVQRLLGRPDPDFAVEVRSNKERFTDGEQMQLAITATKPCHVTVLNVTATGTVVVILPHEHRPTSFVEPGDTLWVPDEAERAMGISYPVTVPEGRRQATEYIQVIATKEKLSLGAGWPRTGHYNQVPTHKAALVHLGRWLLQVPPQERTETEAGYQVEKEF